MNEIFKRLGKTLRSRGYKGSGQNFRKVEDEVICVIRLWKLGNGTVQVQVGAQPVYCSGAHWLPEMVDNPTRMARIKAYDCAWQTTVATFYQHMDPAGFPELEATVVEGLDAFFAQFHTLPDALAEMSAEALFAAYRVHAGARARVYLMEAAEEFGFDDLADRLEVLEDPWARPVKPQGDKPSS